MIHQRYKDLILWGTYYITKFISPIYKVRYSGHSELKLHLGASYNLIDGFLNIDINPLRKGNLFFDIRNRLPFKDGSVNVIFACNVFEHFYPDEIIKILDDVNRVLSNRGIIRIVVPDLEKAIAAYINKDNNFFGNFPRNFKSLGGRFSNRMLCDAQHKNMYDYSFLKELLENSGYLSQNIFRLSYGNSGISQEIYNNIKPYEEPFKDTDLFIEAVK